MEYLNIKGNQLPKTIWILWMQGQKNAPAIIQYCIKSWKLFHPDWDIVVLDQENLNKYVDLDNITKKNANYITYQAMSDVIRLNILAEFGGVWVDATLLCLQPIDTWLNHYLESGFFAFHKPAKDRLVASWFMASACQNPLTIAWRNATNDYWHNNVFTRGNLRGNSIPRKLLRKIDKDFLKKNTFRPRFWFLAPVRKGLRIYPYFWVHYLFADVIANNRKAKEIWNNTPKLSADGPHQLIFFGLLNAPSKTIKRMIDTGEQPMYKLTWKLRGVKSLDDLDNTTIGYAIASIKKLK